jgi:antitoxin component of RelBE/YafQ-DinJ toxin-antitoxin module
MSNVLLTIKTDPDTKRELKEFAAELGVTSTALVNMVVKQAIRDRRIVLNTSLEPTPYLEEVMREAHADRKADRNYTTIKNKTELDEFFKNL